MFRFLHFLVHQEKRFEKIKMTFPVRGHSYPEVDKNMGLINLKARCETPEDWKDVFETARQNPSPFRVRLLNSLPESYGIEENVFLSWTLALNKLYNKKLGFPTRPVKEIVLEKTFPDIQHRSTYNGGWEKGLVSVGNEGNTEEANEFTLPPLSYMSKIPITVAKYADLQHISKFCGQEAKELFRKIHY